MKNCEKLKSCLNKIDTLSLKFSGVFLLILRIYIGLVFIPAGWGKLNNLSQTIEFFKGLNVPLAEIQAPMVAGFEFLFGIFVLLGFLTRISVVPLMGIMVVATLTAHAAEYEGFFSLINILPVNYLLILLALFVAGAGSLSIDSKCATCSNK